MGNILYAAIGVGLVTLFVGSVEQFIPNNIGYYVGMMMPF